MSIKKKLQDDLTVALKAGDKLRTMTLRSVIGAYQTAEKAGKTAVEFNDEEVLAVLKKEAKKRSETSEEYFNLGITDRAEKEKQEADIINEYLPTALTEDEVVLIIESVMADFETPTMKDMGNIMRLVNEQVQGRGEGKFISDFVKSKIG